MTTKAVYQQYSRVAKSSMCSACDVTAVPRCRGPSITELQLRIRLESEAGKRRTVLAQIKHIQIRSIFLKITQTTFFVICLMNGAYILLEVCWSLNTCRVRSPCLRSKAKTKSILQPRQTRIRCDQPIKTKLTKHIGNQRFGSETDAVRSKVRSLLIETMETRSS